MKRCRSGRTSSRWTPSTSGSPPPLLVADLWQHVLWHLLDGRVPTLLPTGERAGPSVPMPAADTWHRRDALRDLAPCVRSLAALACSSRALAALVWPQWPAIAANLVPLALAGGGGRSRRGQDIMTRVHAELSQSYVPGPPWLSRPGLPPRPAPALPCARYPPAYARLALVLAVESVVDPDWLALACHLGASTLDRHPLPHVPTETTAPSAAIRKQATRTRIIRRARYPFEPRCAADDRHLGSLVTPFALYTPESPTERARVVKQRAAKGRGRHTYGRFVGDDVPPRALAEPGALQPVPDQATDWPAHAVPVAFVHPELVANAVQELASITLSAHAVVRVPLRHLQARVGLATPAYARRVHQVDELDRLAPDVRALRHRSMKQEVKVEEKERRGARKTPVAVIT